MANKLGNPKKTKACTPEEFEEFRFICEWILYETEIPQAWLAVLLGYKQGSSYTMALQHGSVHRLTYERAKSLRRGLHQHLNKLQEGRKAG